MPPKLWRLQLPPLPLLLCLPPPLLSRLLLTCRLQLLQLQLLFLLRRWLLYVILLQRQLLHLLRLLLHPLLVARLQQLP